MRLVQIFCKQFLSFCEQIFSLAHKKAQMPRHIREASVPAGRKFRPLSALQNTARACLSQRPIRVFSFDE